MDDNWLELFIINTEREARDFYKRLKKISGVKGRKGVLD